MAEIEQQHRHAIEEAQVAQPYELSRRGQNFGLAALVLFLVFAGWLAYRGATTAAAVVASIDIAAIVAIFVTGQQRSFEEPADDEAEESNDRP